MKAIYYHNAQEKKAVLDCLAQFGDAQELSQDAHFFSAWGCFMEPADSFKPCAHYLAPLNQSFKTAYILKNAIPLPVGASLFTVIGTMMRNMGEGSKIYLHSPKNPLSTQLWIVPEQLLQAFPSLSVEVLPKGWLSLSWGAGLEKDLEKFKSTYPILVKKFSDFKSILINTGHIVKDFQLDFNNSAENAFIYSMHWALETRSILEVIFKDFNQKGALKGLDIGGSYGFLACELAIMNHSLTNLECCEWRVKQIMPWMAGICNVSDRITGVAQRMESMNFDHNTAFDFICFMGSLLCCERDHVNQVLQKAISLLKPGGLIVIRENLNVGQHIDEQNKLFTPNLLNSTLKSFGQPYYYNDLGLRESKDQVGNRWMIYAVVQKKRKKSVLDYFNMLRIFKKR